MWKCCEIKLLLSFLLTYLLFEEDEKIVIDKKEIVRPQFCSRR